MEPIEDFRHGDVPGTILLFDPDHEHGDRAHRGDILLHPTPSSDPEDPLNWTRSRKHLAVSMACLYTFTIGICTAVQYSILTPLSEAQGLTISQLNMGTGITQLMQGWCCLLWQPIAMTYGRRGIYIVTIVLSIGPMIWTPFSTGPGQWYTHRVLLGIATCPVESLPEVTVPDLFFAHERGKYMALYAFVLFGSNFLAPFLAGFINDAAGWRWVMYFSSILIVLCSVIMFFFTEETIYFRQTTEGQDPSSLHIKTANGEAVDTAAQFTQPPRSRLQKLSLVTKLPGRPSNKQMLLKSWRALKILVFFPNILWAAFLYGSNIAWYSVINATISLILTPAPYEFKPTMVGVCYLSPFVFGAISSAWAGNFADSVALKLARRNKGIREPEHRLWGLAIAAMASTGGLIIAISLAYAVDCFKEISGESFVAIIVLRNTMGFAFSYAITPWIEKVGLRNCFISVSMLSLVCTGSFVLMILWGKNLRRSSAERYWRYGRMLVSIVIVATAFNA
ncbi:C2H2 transcription factor [Purpureocillium lavendulum]|uniref:C2H2 transcription factor n=1 Tax=Purpureocillium lavendulum TaxID=1247861 RepID=A0AB34FZM3_9HYPO|nr:C2H2 transcription factor [Purpureocillium lavendulum]